MTSLYFLTTWLSCSLSLSLSIFNYLFLSLFQAYPLFFCISCKAMPSSPAESLFWEELPALTFSRILIVFITQLKQQKKKKKILIGNLAESPGATSDTSSSFKIVILQRKADSKLVFDVNQSKWPACHF